MRTASLRISEIEPQPRRTFSRRAIRVELYVSYSPGGEGVASWVSTTGLVEHLLSLRLDTS
jgi:hypothetical protein